MYIPKAAFLTKGVGIHKDRLASFELALRDAGIEKCNLVSVSSILPPKCKIIPKDEGLKNLSPGQITFCVYARNDTNEPNRLIAAAIGVALPKDTRLPKDTSIYGYLSEHHSFGEVAKKLVNMRRTSQLPCLQLLWALILILTRHGMKESKYTKQAVTFSGQTIFARLQKAIRMDCGQLFLQQLFFWKVRKIHE